MWCKFGETHTYSRVGARWRYSRPKQVCNTEFHETCMKICSLLSFLPRARHPSPLLYSSVPLLISMPWITSWRPPAHTTWIKEFYSSQVHLWRWEKLKNCEILPPYSKHSTSIGHNRAPTPAYSNERVISFCIHGPKIYTIVILYLWWQ